MVPAVFEVVGAYPGFVEDQLLLQSPHPPVVSADAELVRFFSGKTVAPASAEGSVHDGATPEPAAEWWECTSDRCHPLPTVGVGL